MQKYESLVKDNNEYRNSRRAFEALHWLVPLCNHDGIDRTSVYELDCLNVRFTVRFCLSSFRVDGIKNV